MSTAEIVAILEELIEGRNSFLSSNTIRALPFHERGGVLARYMSNELVLVDTINRIYSRRAITDAATTLLTFTIPPSFMEPVAVVPTSVQVNASLEDQTSMTGNCAVCQDAISGAGCRIRQCGHSFHRGCIVSWFLMSVHCPVCRHDIREENLQSETSPASS